MLFPVLLSVFPRRPPCAPLPLVARVYDLDAAVDGSVIESHHLIAGHRKTLTNSKRCHLSY
jgi:hypothetical protein